MNITRHLFLLSLLLLLPFNFVHAGQKLLRVGIFPFKPINYLNKNNEAQGLSPAILRKIAKEHDWLLTFVDGSFAECLARLQSDEIDLVMSVAYTRQRAKVMDYTVQPIVEQWGQVFVRPENADINISDLAGKPLGALGRGIVGQNLTKTANSHEIAIDIHDFHNNSDVFAAVQDGKIFAGVAPQHFGLRNAKEYGLVPSSILFSPYSVHFSTKKGRHADVLRLIDETLFHWKRDNNSYYYQQLAYWLGLEVKTKALPFYLKCILLAVAGISLLLFFNSILLKLRIKKRTAELRKSEDRFRSLVETASDWIWEVDAAGRYTYASARVQDLLGYAPQEMLGKTAFEMMIPEDAERIKKEFQRIVESRQPFYLLKNTNFHRDGRKIVLETSGTPFFDEYDNLIGYRGIDRDITERQKAEESLRLALHGLDSSISGITLAGLDGTLTYANAAFQAMWGATSPYEFIGKPALARWEDSELTEAILNDLPDSDTWSVELVGVRPDGSRFTTQASIFVVRNQQGKPLSLMGTYIDISGRKEMEQALQKSESELSAIYNTAPGILLVIDSECRACKVNQATLEFFGHREEDIVGAAPGDIFRCQYVDRRLAACGSSKECDNCVFRRTVSNAIDQSKAVHDQEVSLAVYIKGCLEKLYFLVSVLPLKYGEETHSLICLQDITEIKQIQFALIESEERFRTLFDQASEPIFVMDSAGKLQDSNQQFCKVLGYSRTELLEMKIFDIDVHCTEPELRQCQEKLSSGASQLFMDRVYRGKSGQLLDMEISVSPIKLQNETLIMTVARDVTMRKNAENALKVSEQRFSSLYHQFKTLLDAISDPLVLLSPEMKKVWSNRAYEELSKETACPEVLHGRSAKFGVRDLKVPVEKCFKEGTVIEEIIRSPDKRMWGVKVFPLKETEEQDPLALAVAVDISEKVQLREEANRANRLASLGELAAGLAHEINNPNAVILLNAPIIKDAFSDAEKIIHTHYKQHGEISLAGLDFAEVQLELPLLIDRVQQSAERIKRIVEDLKSYVRGQGTQEFEQVDLNEVTHAGIRLLENTIEQSTDHFSFKPAKGLPPIMGNFQKLEQVVINLVQNACQALTQRSQRLAVETCFNRNEGTVVLQVRDQGHGIAEDKLSRVKDPFYTTKRNIGGTGLGLSVSERILQEHRAQLLVESELGQGTLFSVLIPACRLEE